MKGRHFFLVLVVAAFGANADGLGNQFTLTYPNVPVPLAGELTLQWSATFAFSSLNDPYGSASIPDLFASFRQDMVNDVRATRAFIHREEAEASKYDTWLLLLAALGLIVLQLRRTHKSLPQRSILAY